MPAICVVFFVSFGDDKLSLSSPQLRNIQDGMDPVAPSIGGVTVQCSPGGPCFDEMRQRLVLESDFWGYHISLLMFEREDQIDIRDMITHTWARCPGLRIPFLLVGGHGGC